MCCERVRSAEYSIQHFSALLCTSTGEEYSHTNSPFFLLPPLDCHGHCLVEQLLRGHDLELTRHSHYITHHVTSQLFDPRRVQPTCSAFLNKKPLITEPHKKRIGLTLMASINWKGILAVAFVFYLRTVAAQSEGDVRLVGPRRNEGRVEIFHNGVWGTVCDDRFDRSDARVICKQLGFLDVARNGVKHLAFFGQGTGPIWMDGLSCRGTERRLDQCPFNGYGKHDCRHSEDAGVVCTRPQPVALPELPLRISCPPDHQGSCNTCPVKHDRRCSHAVAVQGILEARVRGQWHPISGERWSGSNARVACGQLGFPVAFSSPTLDSLWPTWVSCSDGASSGDLLSCSSEQSQFFQRLRRTVLGAVECVGKENTLLRCYYPVIGPNTNTDVSNVATVSCGYGPARSCFGSTAEVSRSHGWDYFGCACIDKTLPVWCVGMRWMSTNARCCKEIAKHSQAFCVKNICIFYFH